MHSDHLGNLVKMPVRIRRSGGGQGCYKLLGDSDAARLGATFQRTKGSADQIFMSLYGYFLFK